MDNVFIAAFVKFAILGTAGEIAAKLIVKKKVIILQSLYSLLVWGLLGVLIKFCFTGFAGFTAILFERGWLPSGAVSNALFMSLFTNAMFGPWVIILHRLLDSLYTGKPAVPTEGLKGAMLTLVWFWIPAHTITFYLPEEHQILLAAIWSFVLGLMLGIFKSRAIKNKFVTK